MFDAESDLAALVYGPGQDPDAMLRELAANLNKQGRRAVGLVQLARRCADSAEMSAMLLHDGAELPLLQELGSCATGCRLDVGRLLDAGAKVADALDGGADLLIINRFGKQECAGKGLVYLIERALDADIPVIIAVSSRRFDDWISFSGGMSVKLPCDRDALDSWWRGVSRHSPPSGTQEHVSVCAAVK
jgi:hypothetical protein